MVRSFAYGMTVRCINDFSEKGRGLGHVTPKIFGIGSNIPSKLLQIQTSNLVCNFVIGKSSGCINNFPQKGRGLGHVTPTFLCATAYML